MTEYSVPQPTHVTCYSGRSYADRPASFVWQGILYKVKEIDREWLSPGERHFVVMATSEKGEKDEKRFQICYHERDDSWSVIEL